MGLCIDRAGGIERFWLCPTKRTCRIGLSKGIWQYLYRFGAAGRVVDNEQGEPEKVKKASTLRASSGHYRTYTVADSSQHLLVVSLLGACRRACDLRPTRHVEVTSEKGLPPTFFTISHAGSSNTGDNSYPVHMTCNRWAEIKRLRWTQSAKVRLALIYIDLRYPSQSRDGSYQAIICPAIRSVPRVSLAMIFKPKSRQERPL